MQLYIPVHERFERYCKIHAYGEFHFKDIMHDAHLIAYEKFDRIKSKEAFLHFLFAITVRVLSNQRKKKRPLYFDNFTNKFEHISIDENTIELRLEIENLNKQLQSLDHIVGSPFFQTIQN